MLIQAARGRLIGVGALLLLITTIVGWWSLSTIPTPVPSTQPDIYPPVVTPVASLSPEPLPPLAPVQVSEPTPEQPIAKEASPVLSPAEEKARTTVEGYPAERERILAELEAQSLEETISQALHVWPSDAFTAGFSRGPFVNDRQKYLLQDPRLAKVLHAAVNGTEEERAAIQAQVMQIIENVLAERQKRDEGLDYNEELLETSPGREIFPIVLAEVDMEGTSLPLLLKWYEADRSPGWSEAELRTLEERTERLGGSSGRISDAARGDEVLIAAAARLIAERTGEPLHVGEGTVLDPLGDGDWVFPGGRLEVSVVDELQGYVLFDQLMLFESDQIMNTLRTRLQEAASRLSIKDNSL